MPQAPSSVRHPHSTRMTTVGPFSYLYIMAATRVSGNQLDKLGKRLMQPGQISASDYELLACVDEMYGAAATIVVGQLRDLGFDSTMRGFKSTGSIIDKLHRQGITLRGIQDLAGARIIVGDGRLEQDRVVASIIAAFERCPKAPQVIDRRKDPSFGYRAVHVIIYEEGVPVEVQVRTVLQDIWAQISEKLGDMWGRGIRYGGQPEDPDAPMFPDEPDSRSRASMLDVLMHFSESINYAENFQANIPSLVAAAAATDIPSDRKRNLDEAIHRAVSTADSALASMEEVVGRLLAIVARMEIPQ